MAINAGTLAPELKVLAERLAARLDDRPAAARAVELVLERAPEERLGLAFLLKLAEQSPALVRRALADPLLAGDLVFCLGSSELVGADLSSMESGWLDLFEHTRRETAASLLEPDRYEFPVEGDRRSLGQALLRFKRLEFLKIAIADLLGRLSVSETMELMSRLADECIAAALRMATQLMGERGAAAGNFCVLALGKLGVNELNLSSDLDLVYIYEAADPEAAREPAARLGELLTELLGGGCFRIDLRLRPGGQRGPLVHSLAGALGFYQNFGQTWERAALLRARPAAGAIEIGRRLIDELSQFIYRKYLDFDTLSQLRQMKRQIEEELRVPEMLERNLKLGRGGIRELEFIIQALTLVYGGRDPRLRDPRTLVALERLDSFGYLASDRARGLAAAYLFLRDVEHKLQVVAGLQTHSLPADASGMRALGARMRFGKDSQATVRFRAALGEHREFVNAVFREMLAAGAEPGAAAASAAALAAWRSALEPKVAAESLALLKFARPAESAGHLLLLARGPEHAPPSTRRRELLERLGPRLLDEISLLPDPDLALMNLAAFIAAVGARTSFLALLESHPATRAVLLSLFASSGYLSSLFVRHPDMLDTLVRSDLARLRRSVPELARELGGLIAASRDFEDRLDVLRTFRHQEFLRIAIADLAGNLEFEEVQAELTKLAEAVLQQALAMARDEVAARFPVPDSLKLSAIAMGRLGAAEMAYNSDLDLIFVYSEQAEAGARGREAAAKIVQKLVAILEARTREGYAYKLDLRLRPSGQAGPLVTSLEGFLDYHRQSSAMWERQALVRARVIAGDPELGAKVEAARQEFVFGRGLTAAEVAEIAAMRRRMETEIGPEDRQRLNLKQGRGGLVDVEFLSQMLALRYGWKHPELRQRASPALLAALRRCGVLAAEDADHLLENYRFLSRLENRLRIESDRAAWALSTDPAELAPLARRMGLEGAGSAERLLEELDRRRSQNREIFLRYFAAEQARAE